MVYQTMRVKRQGSTGTNGVVWAIGDCAAVPDVYGEGRPCPPTAQHAIRQGRLVARNVVATIRGEAVRPFRYRTKGVTAELGHNEAVAITLGVRWRGFPAWLIARTYHLLLMPGLGRKLRLLADWNVALAFGRDASSPDGSVVRPRSAATERPSAQRAKRTRSRWSRDRPTGVS